jgi:hypothetical protein
MSSGRPTGSQRAPEFWEDCGLVFTTGFGTPLSPRNDYRRDLDRVPLRLDLDDDHLLGGAWRFVEQLHAHVAAGLGPFVGSASTAPTSRIVAMWCGKIPTMSVRRPISCRSTGGRSAEAISDAMTLTASRQP